MKQIFFIFGLLLLHSCNPKHSGTDNTVEDGEGSSKHLNLTVWAWQVSDPELCNEYASYAKNLGFDGIDFCVTWRFIEKERGEYEWTWLDRCLDIFVENGLNLSLSLMFWSQDLAWTQNLCFQQNENGKVFQYDADRGPGLCYNDPQNLEIIYNTTRAFATHCIQRYPDKIERFHARTSCYGELEYSPVEDLDFSPPAISGFLAYLQDKFKTVEEFNKAYRLNVASLEETNTIPFSTLIYRTRYDWRNFKQKTLIELSAGISQAFKSVAPEVPVAIQVGSIWDQAAASLRGVFDGYLISRDVDILHIDDGPSYPHYFSIDMASSLAPDRIISMEIDGAWQIQMFPERDIPGEYLNQAKQSGESGVILLNTANWQTEQLKEWGGSLLSLYKNAFLNAIPRKPVSPVRAIFVNTSDMTSRDPSMGLDAFLLDIHTELSENGKYRVRFVSEGMLLANPGILNELKNGLYLGNYTDIRITPEMARLLISATCPIYGAISKPLLMDPYGNELDQEIEDGLMSRIIGLNLPGV